MFWIGLLLLVLAIILIKESEGLKLIFAEICLVLGILFLYGAYLVEKPFPEIKAELKVNSKKILFFTSTNNFQPP